MLWLKAFHVIAVIAWMAGLLYLPMVVFQGTTAVRVGHLLPLVLLCYLLVAEGGLAAARLLRQRGARLVAGVTLAVFHHSVGSQIDQEAEHRERIVAVGVGAVVADGAGTSADGAGAGSADSDDGTRSVRD